MDETEILKVSVPASTANLGPGFDCLGMALDMRNTLEFAYGETGLVVEGEGRGVIETQASNLVLTSFHRAFDEIGRTAPDVAVRCVNRVPLFRGLGSSATAVVGGLVAANEMSGLTLPRERLLEIADEIEGHPDNVVAALFGGCRIVVRDGNRLVTMEVPLPEELRLVTFIPEFEMPTADARSLLGPSVSRTDAVYNIGRTALLVAALASDNLDHLRVATQDRLHQPQRQAVFPAMKNIIEAALGAGAHGAALSGSGSTVLAFTTEKEMTVGYEMSDAAAKSGVRGDVKVLRPSAAGACADRERRRSA